MTRNLTPSGQQRGRPAKRKARSGPGHTEAQQEDMTRQPQPPRNFKVPWIKHGLTPWSAALPPHDKTWTPSCPPSRPQSPGPLSEQVWSKAQHCSSLTISPGDAVAVSGCQGKQKLIVSHPPQAIPINRSTPSVPQQPSGIRSPTGPPKPEKPGTRCGTHPVLLPSR